ncbi:FAD-dependent monooxygenase [Actinomadura opuntiae]|uniref:FAD-dependent monooxygenase n=1 Tax=Actinomadura sp. OS1-43 TaxID=604315 RepID=UPI00255AAF72|nr:FAD-dependent monooxygenase [Actinomadura sp. OS1-43]MDL4821794.1 FAD-dependent monooxygenase [Actinomadura sp. OS1-43]
MNAPAHVGLLVVGGGIGGMAAALAAARAGRPVHLLERAAQFTEIGAGLQVGPNAVRVLADLGLYPRVRDVAVFPEGGVFMDALTGEHLTTLDVGPAFRDRYGAPYLVMHRSDLLEILLEACRSENRITLENGREVTHVAHLPDGAVQVDCADGSRFRAQAVIGADGLNSRVRGLVSADEPVCSGYAAYRGIMPMGDLDAHIGEASVVIWIGPGMHLVQYPIRRGELYNTVAVFRSDAYARGEADWGGPVELDERFADACPEVRRGIQHVDRSRYWKTYDRDPLSTWTSGRVTLLGDAAHPMLQYLGQGACQALEDAAALGKRFAEYGDDYDKVLADYERQRLHKASRAQTAARTWGEIWHTDGIGRLLRNYIFTSRAHDDYTHTDWLYLPEPAQPKVGV